MINTTPIEKHAFKVAGIWMQKAVKEIDRIHGEGYAKENPALVAAFLETAAHNLATLNQRVIAETEEVTQITIRGDGGNASDNASARDNDSDSNDGRSLSYVNPQA
ncbi:TPA: hypothetical protein ACIBOM_000863 [Salmonella enterica subsp. enterica serovar Reading]